MHNTSPCPSLQGVWYAGRQVLESSAHESRQVPPAAAQVASHDEPPGSAKNVQLVSVSEQ